MSKVKFIKPIEVTPAMVVSSSLFDIAPTVYTTEATYGLGVYVSVVGLLGEILIYKSLQAGNIGNTPSSSPNWWVYSSSTYALTRSIFGAPLGYRLLDFSDTTYIYESLTEYNTNTLDPIAYPPWVSVGTNTSTLPTEWNASTTYSIGSRVLLTKTTSPGVVILGDPSDVVTYQKVWVSNTDSNLNLDPDPYPPYLPPGPWSEDKTHPVPWEKTMSYSAGRVVYTPDGKLWQTSKGCSGVLPSLSYTNTWLKLRPSNRTAMFDNQTATGSVANKALDVTVASGIITSVGLIGVNADTAKLTVRDGLGGTIVFQKTIGLSGGNASNGWDYYFSDPTVRKKQAFIDGIPPYLDSHVTLELSGAGEIGIGNFILGTTKELGIPENGLSSEMLDFSKKVTDDFGRTTFVRRGFKRTLDLNMFVDNSRLSKVESMLEDVRATPILVIASDNPDYSETAIRYCFYKTFRTEISYPTFAFVSIQFEGLI